MRKPSRHKVQTPSWHGSMYDRAFIGRSIGSPEFLKRAEDEVDFILKVTKFASGARALDVPCGAGRHSRRLAERGLKVLGLDISKDCIKWAKTRAAHRNARYRLGNMGDLRAYRGQFDLVVNLFTSFGYFSTDKENQASLQGFVRALRPGGAVVIQTIDRDWILPRFEGARWYELGGVTVLEASRYDAKSKYNSSHVFIFRKRSKGAKLIHHHFHRVRLYSRPEMVRLLRAAGLKKVKVFGDVTGAVSRAGQSRHPIYVGWK